MMSIKITEGIFDDNDTSNGLHKHTKSAISTQRLEPSVESQMMALPKSATTLTKTSMRKTAAVASKKSSSTSHVRGEEQNPPCHCDDHHNNKTNSS